MTSAILEEFPQNSDISDMLKDSHAYRDACIQLLDINLSKLEVIASNFGKMSDNLQIINDEKKFKTLDSINWIEGYKILTEIKKNYESLLIDTKLWPYAKVKFDELYTSVSGKYLGLTPLMEDFNSMTTQFDINLDSKGIQEIGDAVEAFKKKWKNNYPVITTELEWRYQDFLLSPEMKTSVKTT